MLGTDQYLLLFLGLVVPFAGCLIGYRSGGLIGLVIGSIIGLIMSAFNYYLIKAAENRLLAARRNNDEWRLLFFWNCLMSLLWIWTVLLSGNISFLLHFGLFIC